ncbi:unnamed protein product [Eruca vesicaria subsp. sativa]|uniref:GCK domain-containing protein n=1 Tax=Eruca vesicaria subsp. sativa TaxID=29727 RepID=A0ABC8J0K9_ERUVS|nr:unnamed protein product [Eruca vesicaria subsp. sativa]
MENMVMKSYPVESRDEEEEEGKCGHCLLMKGGDCRDSFTAWEVCVEEAKDEDLVTKCMDVTNTLYKCVVAHTEPFLTAEKVVREEQVKNEEISEEARKVIYFVDVHLHECFLFLFRKLQGEFEIKNVKTGPSVADAAVLNAFPMSSFARTMLATCLRLLVL